MKGKNILAVAAAIVVVVIIIAAAVFVLPGKTAPQNEVEVTAVNVIVHNILSGYTGSVGSVSGFNVPVGQPAGFVIGIPDADPHYAVQITGIQSNTTGFSVVNATPLPPHTIPPSTTQNFAIYLNTPDSTYSGPVSLIFDYQPLSAVVLSPFIYVVDSYGLVLLNPVNSTISTVQVGNFPLDVAATQNGTFAFVTNMDSSTVSVVNVSLGNVTSTIHLPVNASPISIALNPVSNVAYITSNSTDNIYLINTLNDTYTRSINIGNESQDVAVNPTGTLAYITNINAGSVTVMKTSDDSVVKTIPVGSQPFGIAVSPENDKVYVANINSSTVSVINITTNKVTKTIALPNDSRPTKIAFTPDGTKAYVVEAALGKVAVIDTMNDTVVQTIGVGISPYGVAVEPDGLYAFVTNIDSISVINVTSDNVITTVGGVSGAYSIYATG